MLATGMMVGGSYAVEFFIAWYSGNAYEQFTFLNRATGPFFWAYFTMVTCNVLVPQFFWIKRVRRSVWTIFVLSLLINVGMWFERFVIIGTSLSRTFVPSSWSYYQPTIYDVGVFVGSFGLFFTMFFLFIRFVPAIAIAEVKLQLPEAHSDHGKKH
jgi:molybdopterin-containing oxidoreductase family membrane subunit